jgi:hypothetical protein
LLDCRCCPIGPRYHRPHKMIIEFLF